MSKVPEHLKFTTTHEWLDNEATISKVGITDHAQALLGDLVFIELPTVGKQVQSGEELGVVESVKAASDFYAPISGTIKEVNELIVSDPAIVNRDPYGEGWLVKIESNHPEEIQHLLDANQYQHEITEVE